MRHFLLFLSSLLVSFALSAGVTDMKSVEDATMHRYQFELEKPGAGISGILLLQRDGDEIKGSLINEFGVSALDFVYNESNGGLKLINVVSFLDKWYIKRVLKRDLKVCLEIIAGSDKRVNSAYDVVCDNGTTVVTNRSRKLKYSFSPLPNQQDINETEE